MSEHATSTDDTPFVDRDVVERWLSQLERLEWGEEGQVELLVETPEPHRHAVRDQVEVVEGKGFAGDHDRKSYYKDSYVPGREVSAITAEVLDVCGVEPSEVGDNLVTRGIDLRRLKAGDLLQMGEVVLACSERPHRPCATFRSRSSPEAFAVAARDGFRGALFTVRKAGVLREGDRIRRLPANDASATGAA